MNTPSTLLALLAAPAPPDPSLLVQPYRSRAIEPLPARAALPRSRRWPLPARDGPAAPCQTPLRHPTLRSPARATSTLDPSAPRRVALLAPLAAPPHSARSACRARAALSHRAGPLRATRPAQPCSRSSMPTPSASRRLGGKGRARRPRPSRWIRTGRDAGEGAGKTHTGGGGEVCATKITSGPSSECISVTAQLWMDDGFVTCRSAKLRPACRKSLPFYFLRSAKPKLARGHSSTVIFAIDH